MPTNILKTRYLKLIDTLKTKEVNEKTEALLEALTEASTFVDTLTQSDEEYEHFETIAACLENLKAPNALSSLEEVLNSELFKTDEDIQSSSRNKAICILVIAAFEFLVLALVLGALAALAGAVVLGVGFAAATWALTAVPEPVLLQTVALAGIIIGAIIGGLLGLYKAGDITYSHMQKLKTCEWAGFEAYDSIWELAIKGKGKNALIAERVSEYCSFFKTKNPDNAQQPSSNNLNVEL